LENHVSLSRGVPVAGATWRTATMIVAGVVDLMQRTGDDRTCQVLGGRTIGMLGDAMCSLYCARGDDERVFVSGLGSKPLGWFLPGFKTDEDDFLRFVLKTSGDGLLLVWLLNHYDIFLRFSLKTGSDGFL
jgi:hypothetical protein